MKILKPLSVPWMIDPSMPKITLISEEHGNHLVKFCALFGFEGAANKSSDSITVDTGALLVSPNEKSARYQLISLKFELVEPLAKLIVLGNLIAGSGGMERRGRPFLA
jgi:hypothetical protein